MDVLPRVSPDFGDPDVPGSPCNGFCTLDADGLRCLGCTRTLEQIREWPFLSAEDRQRILTGLSRGIGPDRPGAGPVVSS